jgi:hypothetical protein
MCRSPINSDISNLCDHLETALWERYPENSPIDLRFDPRELNYLPLELSGQTASIAAGITGVFLQIFNQEASEYEILCPESIEHDGNINQCFSIGESLLVILKPSA